MTSLRAVSLLLFLIPVCGCPRPAAPSAAPSGKAPAQGESAAPGDASPPETPAAEASPREAPQAASAGELAAWKALQARTGGWARLLPGQFKDEAKRAKLEPALEPGAELRRVALLARFLPLREKHTVINLEGPLRRHLEKNALLKESFPLGEDRTVLLVVLMDPAFLSRIHWWRDEGGAWLTLHEALTKGDDPKLRAASASLRAGVDHAHGGRWEQAAQAWTQGLSAAARRSSALDGKGDAWEAVDLGADPEALREALDAWWRSFVPVKPSKKAG